MSDSKVLFITGAESFVGKRLLKHCEDLGVKYQGVDIVGSEDPNISQMDICDTNLSKIIPEGAIVVHLAAVSRDSDCAANPTLANKINIEGTLNLLRSAQKQNAGQLIFASSEWVYGQVSNDDEQSIATSYALTALKFADFWQHNKFDLVFCLGDRFEMSAAVQAGIPFNVKFAHLHGGETTLGAIDNIYRKNLTL